MVVDAAMNDLLRPSFYQAYHHVLPIKKSVPCVSKSLDFLFNKKILEIMVTFLF